MLLGHFAATVFLVSHPNFSQEIVLRGRQKFCPLDMLQEIAVMRIYVRIANLFTKPRFQSADLLILTKTNSQETELQRITS